MSNLQKRILTALVGVPIVLWLVYLAPGWAFVLFIGGIAFVSTREYFGIVASDSRRMTILGPLLSAVIVLALGFFPDRVEAWATVGTLIPLVALLALLFRPGDISDAPVRSGLMSLGLLYTGVLAALVAVLHGIPEHGPGYVILLLMTSFFGDTGAYTAGRIFGKHPLYPKISPKKTWEGSIGGLLASAGAAVLAHYWYLPALPLVPGLFLGLFLGAFEQIGDLCESMLKRAFDVKDSGRLLPGHGGMLDRIDGVLFAVALLFLVRLWIPIFP